MQYSGNSAKMKVCALTTDIEDHLNPKWGQKTVKEAANTGSNITTIKALWWLDIEYSSGKVF